MGCVGLREQYIAAGVIVPASMQAQTPGVLYMDAAANGRACDHEGAFWEFVNETNEWEMPAMEQDADWSAFFVWAYGPVEMTDGI